MPDLSIRNFSSEEYAAIKQKASQAEQSMEGWVKSLILQALKEPVVESRYILRAFGPGSTMAFIRRTPDGISDPREGQTNLSDVQQIAYQKALEYIKRNGPMDREQAIKALSDAFETVFETVM